MDSQSDMNQLLLDKVLVQGKLEIACDVLHDIGNAVVGFGSILTRIKRTGTQSNSGSLRNLAGLFTQQRSSLEASLGAARLDAVIELLNGIANAQDTAGQELEKSLDEQLRIMTHIQEILNVQRQYAAGVQSTQLEPVNLRSVINDCLSMLYASFEKRNIAVHFDQGHTPPVLASRTSLMQVVLNILKNSIESLGLQTEDKHITVTLVRQPDGVFASISDNGEGFDEATGASLFTRGFTTKSSGTGLGLHNCRILLESQGASIGIHSPGPSKGATTTISFKNESIIN